jgi:hypothetical protein
VIDSDNREETMTSPAMKRLLMTEAKVDAMLLAFRSFIELHPEDRRRAFKQRFLDGIERMCDIGIATSMDEEYFDELRRQAQVITENLL